MFHIFKPTKPCGLQDHNTFDKCQVYCVCTKSFSFVGPEVWDVVPNEIKQVDSLKIFKSKSHKSSLQAPQEICI